VLVRPVGGGEAAMLAARDLRQPHDDRLDFGVIV
jgi:NADPH-dependent 2,4-dienoyl-CoA reductase/sulfur reductase-like enzyme